LRQNTLFLGDLQFILHQQYQCLSAAEKNILITIAKIDQPLSLQELITHYDTRLRCSEIMDCLNNLKRRSLVDTVSYQTNSKNMAMSILDQDENSQINFYSIQPVVRKYIKSQI
ncbi:MAG: hypothetical protein ACRC8K_14875, partial [Waterburya sp.]